MTITTKTDIETERETTRVSSAAKNQQNEITRHQVIVEVDAQPETGGKITK